MAIKTRGRGVKKGREAQPIETVDAEKLPDVPQKHLRQSFHRPRPAVVMRMR